MNPAIAMRIHDFDGYYISSNGQVYSDLGQGCRDRSKRVDLYEIKPRLAKNGYHRVYMRQTSTGKRVDRYVHRLTAEYFVPNPDNKNIVNHIDCDRGHNDSRNLHWVTSKENNEYSMSLDRLKRDPLTGRFTS